MQQGFGPSRDLISDMCMTIGSAFQFVPWPLRVDNICDNTGINNPDNTGICPLLDLVKMLLDNLQSSYPMVCAVDSIALPAPESAGECEPVCVWALALRWM